MILHLESLKRNSYCQNRWPHTSYNDFKPIFKWNPYDFVQLPNYMLTRRGSGQKETRIAFFLNSVHNFRVPEPNLQPHRTVYVSCCGISSGCIGVHCYLSGTILQHIIKKKKKISCK